MVFKLIRQALSPRIAEYMNTRSAEKTPDSSKKIVQFVQPTPAQALFKLAVPEIFIQGIEVTTTRRLDSVEENTEDTVGELPLSLRSSFHHLLNICSEAERLAAEHDELQTALSQRIPPEGTLTDWSDDQIYQQTRRLRAITGKCQDMGVRLEIEIADFQSMVWKELPDLYGKTIAIKAGYVITEFTLPKDRSWTEKVPPHLRARIAGDLLDEGYEVTDFDESLVLPRIAGAEEAYRSQQYVKNQAAKIRVLNAGKDDAPELDQSAEDGRKIISFHPRKS